MKRLMTISVFLLSAGACPATGWNDYQRDIGDGYSIFRANSFDLGISYKNGVLINPDAFKEIGPVYGYFMTADYLFARAYGRKIRNLSERVTTEETDASKQFYFVLKKGGNEITGPLSLVDFEANAVVREHSPVRWQPPRNPNFWLPLLGNLMFLAIAIPILAAKFFWITIPVFLAIMFWVMHPRSKRGEMPSSRRTLGGTKSPASGNRPTDGIAAEARRTMGSVFRPPSRPP